MRRPRPIAAFDTLGCLLMVFVIIALAAIPQSKPTPTTEGQYAVIATWSSASTDDVDLYVREPTGYVVYYVNLNAGYMHLEHDDLGIGGSRFQRGQPNVERAVLRQDLPGEYVANVHMYVQNQHGPTPVTVTLWRMTGEPKALLRRTVVLTANGQELTAFRFSVKDGQLLSHSTEPFHIVSSSLSTSGPGGGQYHS